MVYILIAVVLGAGLAYFAVLYSASELGGEVVVLHRSSSDGSVRRVRIWIVEDGEQTWVEHGPPDADWISMLATTPVITLERYGEPNQYHAAADPGSHAHYHALRAAKYGIADRIVEFATGDVEECAGIPVRIEAVRP